MCLIQMGDCALQHDKGDRGHSKIARALHGMHNHKV